MCRTEAPFRKNGMTVRNRHRVLLSCRIKRVVSKSWRQLCMRSAKQLRNWLNR